VIVVDATALIDYLLNRPEVRDRVDLEITASRDRLIHVPEVAEPEILNALRGLMLGGKITERRALEAVNDLAFAPLIGYPHAPLRERIWELRHELTAYDAAYLALAEGLDSTLITADAGLAARARHSIGAERVRMIG
jgi:predicted nucleic acid-binding protein